MFTGAIKLAQIDDYISPGQSCIQPKIMTKLVDDKAGVSLNDCLACSGCVTSAESLLVEQMSIDKFLKVVESQDEIDIMVIIAPQTVLNLARHYNLSPSLVLGTMSAFLRAIPKVRKIFDLKEILPKCHSLVQNQFRSRSKKTLLCSQCPGWVCYAQKTLSEDIVDHMSVLKSPQQIFGRDIKQRYPQCYTVSIMACYDKKLEAIRFQFENKIKEIDLTITTGEFLELVKRKSSEGMFTGNQLENKPCDYFFGNLEMLGFLSDQTSNGYLSSLLKRLKANDVAVTPIKNNDFLEYNFSSQGVAMKMAKCYGFRNIQKIVQLLKRKKCQYSYVEIMACPGGCFNGGGQIRQKDVKEKESFQAYQAIIMQQGIAIGDKPQQHHEMVEGYKALYKPIEKTLAQSVLNW